MHLLKGQLKEVENLSEDGVLNWGVVGYFFKKLKACGLELF